MSVTVNGTVVGEATFADALSQMIPMLALVIVLSMVSIFIRMMKR
jgi:hypothetical protein